VDLLADQFYFIAHDDRAGKRRLAQRALGVGLAAALLGELVITGHVDVHDTSVYIISREPPRDALSHRVLSLLANQPHHRDVRVWLAYLAEIAPDQVAERLVLVGALRQVSHRRLIGTRTTYVPADQNRAAWQSIRLERLLCSYGMLHVSDAFLAALVSATGLTWHVLWDPATSAPGLRNLPHVIHHLPQPLRGLAGFTEVMVGQVVLAPR
jgi:hypothetical protein